MNKHLLMAGTVGLLGLTACGWFGEDAAETMYSTANAAPAVDQAPQAISGLQLEPVSYAPLVEALSPAVVNVEVQGTAKASDVEQMIPEEFRRFFNIPEGEPGQPDQKTQGAGSGFVISADGYILTNNHVIADADTITVTFTDEQRYEATLVGADARIDVALLKIEADALPYVKLGEPDDARVGDRVVAIGNPFGLGHTVTTGIVSGKGRALGAGPYDDFLQTDAAINPGNSGGPLFNLEGEVIGINTAIIAQANNIGFTIPVEMVHDVLDDLKTNGRVARGWLGVGIQTVTPELADAMGIDTVEGVLLGDIHPGGPADGAGLKSGDIVMTIDGEAMEDTSELIRAVGERRADDTVTMTLLRNGKEKTAKVVLAERPSEEALARGVWTAEEEEEAPEVSMATSALGFTLEESPDGVMVASVDPEGPAAQVLRPGDVLLEVDRQRARSASEAVKRLNSSEGAHLLVIQREGRRLFVPFKTG